jgi:hypothetical protein
MWLLYKEKDGILWLDLEYDDVNHFILPIFTSPDTAMDFVGDIKHEGDAVKFKKIETVDELAETLMACDAQPASAIILDAPHPENLTSEEELMYWTTTEFYDIASSLLVMSEDYDDKLIIEILDRYLFNKSKQRMPQKD